MQKSVSLAYELFISHLVPVTLRDYTHYISSNSGFSNEVDNELIRVAKVYSGEEYKKCVCVVVDEMHIKEGLVFNKHTGALVGFVDFGNVSNLILKFERSLTTQPQTNTTTSSLHPAVQLAKSMLVFFVCGLFSKLRFPFAHFPT